MTPYSEADKQFIFENYGKLTIEDIAKRLNRKSNAIHLFLHRHVNDQRLVRKDNLLLQVLRAKFTDPELFRPNRNFFDSVGIKQKRYWALYKGVEVMKDEECIRVANFLNISLVGIFESRQTQLFNE